MAGEGIRSITFGELGEQAARLANTLRGLGVGVGDRVATFMWTNNEHQVAYIGVPAMGAVRSRQAIPSSLGIRPGCDRPRPSLTGTSTSGAPPLPSPRSPLSLARKRVQTEVPSGLTASSVGGSRHRHLEAHCRCPAHPWPGRR
jgi:hypothetical protein